jgi:hypothetical protein
MIYCDCDLKLFDTAISEYCIDNDSKFVAVPANGNYPMVWWSHIGRSWFIWDVLTSPKKHMPLTFLFYAIVHLSWMMNAIPCTYQGHLASPFFLVHGVGHNERTWILLLSLCYFHHKKDSNQHHSKHQAHTMDGIVIGRSPTLNALMVYNPLNQQYYESDSDCIDPYCPSYFGLS